ncbi:MAG: hypothetical protein K2G84_09745 [Muribaculaceae bacterium]|nr:hypothetical protein [Muribaculaceae bacterium]
MRNFIFYTTEGKTIAPDEDYDIDNCQVLGFAEGSDSSSALSNLLIDNYWIIDAGFNQDEIIWREVVD